jgi:hypothetical protein
MLEAGECVAQGGITFLGGPVEAIVGDELAGNLPDALHRVELGRVRRQSMKLDSMAVLGKPGFAFVIEPVAGSVVDDQEDLPSRVTAHEVQQEVVERGAVEDVRELVGEFGSIEAERTKDVRGLSQTVGINTRLDADARPRSMERAVEPETGLVLEEDYPSTGEGFFLMAGNRSRIQTAWASASARASRLRGRCTEKPI